jgi:phosphatidylserine/phosphatidylglycerophosphate/cardiolipin synthase-like enzyme
LQFEGFAIRTGRKHFSFALGGIIALSLTTSAPLRSYLTGNHPAHPTNVDSLHAFEIHYAPTENLEKIDSDLIRSSVHSIDLAAYVLTDMAVIEALTEAANRGVQIRLYLDGSSRSPGLRIQSALDHLFHLPQVSLKIKPAQMAIMHLKGFVIDGQVLRTGSANFSLSGLKYQDNDLLMFRDQKSVQAFAAKFELMWQREMIEQARRAYKSLI